MSKIVEQVLQTMVFDIDNKWVKKLWYVEYSINSLDNGSASKEPFELVYRSNVQTVVDQLDGVHHVENA